MSEEDVEIVRRYVDAFNRRDRDAFLALLDPQFEGIPPSDWPESTPVRGHEAAWDFGLELEEPWQEGGGEITELIGAGNDRTVMGIAARRAGKASGVDLGKFEAWAVISFRGGRIVRLEWFLDRSEALEAAGLSE
jgi:ketosteroid isomerase-like protein